MKKIICSLVLFYSFTTKSQSLILTQNFNEPVIGDTNFSYPIDTSKYSGGLPISITGSNSVWNFTNLDVILPVIPTAYVSTTAVASSSGYAGCNLVQKQGTFYTFLKSTNTPTTQTEVLGVVTSTLSLTFTNTAIAAKYPISYGSSSTDNLSGTFTFSVNGTVTGNINTNADGYGTLNLPNGVSLTNVLRVKSVQSLSLSAALFPPLPASQVGTIKQTTYTYFHSSQKFPVLSLDYTKISLATSTTPTLTSVISGNKKTFVVGLKENTLNNFDFSLFPNPTKDSFTLLLSNSKNEPCWIELYTATGDLVKKLNLGNAAEIKEQVILKGLSSGIYSVKTILGNQTASRRLIVE